MSSKKCSGGSAKRSNVGVLTPQEAVDYIVYTHEVEGIFFTEEEKSELLENIENGTCEMAILQLATANRS
jgi:hypothetical protein